LNEPAVMTEGGIFLLYYFGGNFEETVITNYLKSSSLESKSDDRTSLEDYKLKGSGTITSIRNRRIKFIR